MTTPSPEEIHAYLQLLRLGDPKLIEVNDTLSEDSRNDFDRFRAFLADNGQPNPTPANLYLVVERQEVLAMLTYFANLSCLGLQYCFGFDKPVDQGGQLLLINKGAIVDHPCKGEDQATCEEEIYRSDYQVEGWGTHTTVHFQNFRLDSKLPPASVQTFIDNFGALYRHYPPSSKIPITGSVLSIKRLLSILTDADTVLGTTKLLTLRWGINDFAPRASEQARLGNFTLVIGTGDLSRGPVIERRPVLIKEIGENPGDCPPRRPC